METKMIIFYYPKQKEEKRKQQLKEGAFRRCSTINSRQLQIGPSDIFPPSSLTVMKNS
jgi:hypothetical protein